MFTKHTLLSSSLNSWWVYAFREQDRVEHITFYRDSTVGTRVQNPWRSEKSKESLKLFFHRNIFCKKKKKTFLAWKEYPSN